MGALPLGFYPDDFFLHLDNLVDTIVDLLLDLYKTTTGLFEFGEEIIYNCRGKIADNFSILLGSLGFFFSSMLRHDRLHFSKLFSVHFDLYFTHVLSVINW